MRSVDNAKELSKEKGRPARRQPRGRSGDDTLNHHEVGIVEHRGGHLGGFLFGSGHDGFEEAIAVESNDFNLVFTECFGRCGSGEAGELGNVSHRSKSFGVIDERRGAFELHCRTKARKPDRRQPVAREARVRGDNTLFLGKRKISPKHSSRPFPRGRGP